MIPSWGYSYRSFEPTAGLSAAGGSGVETSHLFTGLSKLRRNTGGGVGGSGGGKTRRDDDLIDRMSHTFTALLLLLFTLVISTRQYIGKPIACWVPAEFTRAQEEYAENVCWVTSTYFLPNRRISVPESLGEREDRLLGYYQWVPFVLMIQAFLFNLPCLIWRLLNWQSGVQLASIMEVACEVHMIKEPSHRGSTVAFLSRYIQDTLVLPPAGCSTATHYRQVQRRGATNGGHKTRSCWSRICRQILRSCLCLWFGRRCCSTGIGCSCCGGRSSCGGYLLGLYLIVKWLYLVNTLAQFYLMNRYLGNGNTTLYGLELLRDVGKGREWSDSGHFPRITLCDFEIRRLGNLHRYTVQCVLPINMVNEKLYIFLWFWLIVMATASAISLVVWACGSGLPQSRLRFIKRFLQLRDHLTPESEPRERRRCVNFVHSFLRADGVFILRLIEENAGQLVTAEVVERLWLAYKKQVDASASCNSQWDETTTAQLVSATTATSVPSTTDKNQMMRLTSPTQQPINTESSTLVVCSRRPPKPPAASVTKRTRRPHQGPNNDDDPGEFV